MIVVSLCLSDIDKSKITESNGKKYISLIVDKRKDVDKYGNTHSVSISQKKEDSNKGEKKVYVGNGKEYLFDNKQTTNTNNNNVSVSNYESGLPF